MQDKYDQMIQALAEQERERVAHILNEIKPETDRRSRDHGFEDEDAAFEALRGANGDAPTWFQGVQRATRRQDLNGTDFFVVVRIETPPGSHPQVYHLPFDTKTGKISAGNVADSDRNRKRRKRGKVPITGMSAHVLTKPQTIRDQVYELVEQDPSLRDWFRKRSYRLTVQPKQ